VSCSLDLKSSIVERIAFAFGTSTSVTNNVKAGDLIKQMAPIVGGKGGGRPDMAQGGGTQPENISKSLSFIKDYIKNL
ncbi:hypothetical protein EX86_14910, partial [Staphylococcus aureus]|uniref:DHHA1 domain-containing protein n=1 Tax=Staphylococcus aureus TaxID=1280 RepID=UPI00065B5AD0